MNLRHAMLARSLAGIALLLPWLNPFSGGPTPGVVPWLFSVFCAVCAWLLSDRLSVRVVATVWVAAAVISAVIGLLQFFDLARWLGQWVNHAQVGEAYANLRQRNQFATLTSIGLLAWLWLLSQRVRSQVFGKWGTDQAFVMLATIYVVLLAMGNAASGSRTGLLQWMFVLVLAIVWRQRQQWQSVAMALASIAIYLMSVLFLPGLLTTVTGVHADGLLGRLSEDAGCASRTILWSNVLHLITQKPWLGWGWGELDYAHFMTLYPGERFCDILDNAHNLPLHLAVELGVPFATAVCGAIMWAVVRSRPWRETDPARQLAWGVLAVIAIHSLLEYPLWYGPFQMAALLSVGLLCKIVPTKKPIALVKSAPTAIVCIAIFVWAGFDYWRVSQLYLSASARSPAYQENTLDKVRGSRLFSNQVAFAEFTTTALTPGNAPVLYVMGLQLLHFSPEPRVVEKLIASADLLGLDDEAASYRVRYRAAFPDAYLRWMSDSAQDEAP